MDWVTDWPAGGGRACLFYQFNYYFLEPRLLLVVIRSKENTSSALRKTKMDHVSLSLFFFDAQ
jgi:hypothetical protein